MIRSWAGGMWLIRLSVLTPWESPYAFVLNSPLMMVDPDGRMSQLAIMAYEMWKSFSHSVAGGGSSFGGTAYQVNGETVSQTEFSLAVHEAQKEAKKEHERQVREEVAKMIEKFPGLSDLLGSALENGTIMAADGNSFQIVMRDGNDITTYQFGEYDFGSETTNSLLADYAHVGAGALLIGTLITVTTGMHPRWSLTVGALSTMYMSSSENRMLSEQAKYTSQGYKLSIINNSYSTDGSDFERGTSYYYNYNKEPYFNNSWNSYHPPIYP